MWPHTSYSLYLRADALLWTRSVGVFRKAIADAGAVELEPFSSSGFDFSLCEALKRLRQSAPIAELVLSDAWLRYDVAPWPVGIGNRHELNSYLLARQSERGIAATERDLLLVRASSVQAPIITCLWTSAIRERITTCFDDAGCRLPSTYPMFGRTFDVFAHRLPNTGTLLVDDGVHLSFGGWLNGRWCFLSSRASGPSDTPIFYVGNAVAKWMQGFGAAGMKLMQLDLDHTLTPHWFNGLGAESNA